MRYLGLSIHVVDDEGGNSSLSTPRVPTQARERVAVRSPLVAPGVWVTVGTVIVSVSVMVVKAPRVRVTVVVVYENVNDTRVLVVTGVVVVRSVTTTVVGSPVSVTVVVDSVAEEESVDVSESVEVDESESVDVSPSPSS